MYMLLKNELSGKLLWHQQPKAVSAEYEFSISTWGWSSCNTLCYNLLCVTPVCSAQVKRGIPGDDTYPKLFICPLMRLRSVNKVQQSAENTKNKSVMCASAAECPCIMANKSAPCSLRVCFRRRQSGASVSPMAERVFAHLPTRPT